MSKLQEAIYYAADAHRSQVRKHSALDYFEYHSLILFSRVLQDPVHGGEEAGLIMLCHDVVEDCSENDSDEARAIHYREIQVRFGLAVYRGVHDLTDEYTKKRHPKLNRRQRKDKERKRLAKTPARSQLLKLYDREINLEDSIRDGACNLNYARESWQLASALSNIENAYQACRVFTLAMQLQEMCHE